MCLICKGEHPARVLDDIPIGIEKGRKMDVILPAEMDKFPRYSWPISMHFRDESNRVPKDQLAKVAKFLLPNAPMYMQQIPSIPVCHRMRLLAT